VARFLAEQRQNYELNLRTDDDLRIDGIRIGDDEAGGS
jgi:hypothetical protein